MFDRVSQTDLERVVFKINSTLDWYWACPTCYCCGYLCCLCTLGLSFIAPSICISEARTRANQEIRKLNKTVLLPKGLSIALIVRGGTSWLEISLNEPVVKRGQKLSLEIKEPNLEKATEKGHLLASK